MDTGIIPAQLADLRGLTLEQIAALDTMPEILARIVPAVPEQDSGAAFQSAI